MSTPEDGPLLSVGLVYFNDERYLALAIRSVLRQTISNFELLLVDDGATDGSREIAQSFKDSRIRLVCDGANRGLAARLNQIAVLARGEYLFRMDADDIMLP